MNHHDLVPIYAELLSISEYCEQAESVAEVHGILCGLLCRDPFLGAGQWIKVLEFEGEPNDTRFQMVRNQLDDLVRHSAQMLNQIDTEFTPVLPDDDEPLSVRIAELTRWCQGFLYGFSAYEPNSNNEYIETYEYEDEDEDESDLDTIRERAAKAAEQEIAQANPANDETEEEELPETVVEILGDFAEISNAAAPDNNDADAEDAADEVSYMELVEYIRVSVQLVFEEMAGNQLTGRQVPIEVDPRFTFDGGDDDNVH